MTELWHSLSEREAGAIGLREGVPDFLVPHLRKWIYSVTGDAVLVERIRIRLGMNWNPAKVEDAEEHSRQALANVTLPDQLLDVVDAALELLPRSSLGMSAGIGWKAFDLARVEVIAQRQPLTRLLDDARSVYQLKPDGSGLMRRASATATAAARKAGQSAIGRPDAGSAGAHLRAAWDNAYSLHPQPDRAYSEAIKAVEAAAHAVVEARNAKATLGTMKNVIRDNPSKFALALGDGDSAVLVRMMSALWEGQTSRHGGMQPTRKETPEEARTGVQIAVCLVEWFTTGLVRRVKPQ